MVAITAKGVLIAVVVGSVVGLASSARVLFFIAIASYSHRVALQPLITKIADRGHDVTVFSAMKTEIANPKIKEFYPENFAQINLEWEQQISAAVAQGRYKDRYYDPTLRGDAAIDLPLQRADALLHNFEFIEWIRNSTFDLIVHDTYHTQYIYPIAHHMNAKLIAFVPTGGYSPLHYDLWGLPLEPWLDSGVPNKFWWLPNFIYNEISPLLWYHTFRNYISKVEDIAREALPFDFPPLSELIKNVDLILTNQHFSHTYAISNPPYVIPVGGMHVRASNGTLPQDLEKFVRGADDFVFVSFGSTLHVSSLPNEIQQTLFDAVSLFPSTRFLWKWEGDIPASAPNNVLFKNWFSQQDVLAHPKCKGFVTHGGILSIQQAIFHKVPVVVVPQCTDQPYNARIAEDLGFGIKLELTDITKGSFFDSIRQILKNKKYAETISQISERFQDQPMSPVDTAVWWTEYVLRHDTTHLKSPGFQQTWWQRRSLDFWFLAFAVLCISATLAVTIIAIVIKKGMQVVIDKRSGSDKIKTT